MYVDVWTNNIFSIKTLVNGLHFKTTDCHISKQQLNKIEILKCIANSVLRFIPNGTRFNDRKICLEFDLNGGGVKTLQYHTPF